MSHVIAGISWPFRIEQAGLPASAKGTELIKSALIVLLRTPAGSRVMRPDLGTRLHTLIFETQGPFLRALVQREILLAVNNYLPMVQVLAVDFREINSRLEINVRYLIQGILDETDFFDIVSTEEDL